MTIVKFQTNPIVMTPSFAIGMNRKPMFHKFTNRLLQI